MDFIKMNRASYFESIKLNETPLSQVTYDLERILEATANNDTGLLLSFADILTDLKTNSAKARASFIRLQIKGINTEDLFEEYRESWGIPKFEDSLVTVDDFKNGFLWTFRDHSTSWSEDNEARNWFYTNLEARFARRYEFWACDRGPEEMLLLESGEYKNILNAIIHKHEDYTPFVSPVFSHAELRSYYNSFDEDEHELDKEALLEIMEGNRNWRTP